MPFTLRKSSSATPDPKVATLPLDIPDVGSCDVNAKVPAVAGKTTDILTGNDDGPSAFTTQYGWQWESRFADGGNITGLTEWVLVVGGMERGKFLPSISSLVGFRTLEGFEMGIGPNISISGLGMVFGFGFTATSGKLNLPINFVFSPAKEGWFDLDSGASFSILLGFNISSK